jgi:hypothetical protein
MEITSEKLTLSNQELWSNTDEDLIKLEETLEKLKTLKMKYIEVEDAERNGSRKRYKQPPKKC